MCVSLSKTISLLSVGGNLISVLVQSEQGLSKTPLGTVIILQSEGLSFKNGNKFFSKWFYALCAGKMFLLSIHVLWATQKSIYVSIRHFIHFFRCMP